MKNHGSKVTKHLKEIQRISNQLDKNPENRSGLERKIRLEFAFLKNAISWAHTFSGLSKKFVKSPDTREDYSITQAKVYEIAEQLVEAHNKIENRWLSTAIDYHLRKMVIFMPDAENSTLNSYCQFPTTETDLNQAVMHALEYHDLNSQTEQSDLYIFPFQMYKLNRLAMSWPSNAKKMPEEYNDLVHPNRVKRNLTNMARSVSYLSNDKEQKSKFSPKDYAINLIKLHVEEFQKQGSEYSKLKNSLPIDLST